MRALKCDRCGAFYDYDYSGRKFGLSDFTRDLTERDAVVDLCPKCQERLNDIMDAFLYGREYLNQAADYIKCNDVANDSFTLFQKGD